MIKGIRDKRGQFYLIAAIIIIAVVVAATALTNYIITKPKPVKFYDISKELNLESEHVVNYGIFNKQNLNSLLGDFTNTYSSYIGTETTNVYFIYGDKDGVEILSYTKGEQGSFSLTLGTAPVIITIIGTQITSSNLPVGEEGDVYVGIGDYTYPFTLKEGENFFFIVEQESGGEKYVTT